MRSHNPDGPLNPDRPVKITPKEYERQVLEWLRGLCSDLKNFKISHLKKLSGASGEYEFDIIAEFSIFGEAEIVVLVECKRYGNAVKRDTVLPLEGKLRDVGAHKGMMFSTGGFQSGALEYASVRGIATLTFIDGKAPYETRDRGPSPEPPPWVDLPRYAAQSLSKSGKRIGVHLVTNEHLEAINAWMTDDYRPNPENREAD